jgi:hypothetical protein
MCVAQRSIARSLNLSDDTVTDSPDFRRGCFSGHKLVLHSFFVRSESGRLRNSVLGAVEIREHNFLSIKIADSIIAELVGELLEKISSAYPGGGLGWSWMMPVIG